MKFECRESKFGATLFLEIVKVPNWLNQTTNWNELILITLFV